MKTKFAIKRILSLLLSLLMAFSCFSIANAADVNCGHPNLKEDGWTVTKEPTCVSEGTKTQYCPDCCEPGEVVTFKIDMLDNTLASSHKATGWVTVIPSTCYQEGKQVKYCVEGCVHTEDCTHGKAGEPWILDERTVPAHDYRRTYYIEPTCVKTGYELLICMVCNDMVATNLPIDEDNHNFSEWYTVKEPTCSQPGEEKRICINCTEDMVACDYFETREIAPDETLHNVENWAVTVPATCYVEGEKEGICTICNQLVTAVAGTHENVTEYQELSRKEPTCYKEGISYRQCDSCGHRFEVEIPVDPDNHVCTDWVTVKEPGCTPGKREYFCLYHEDYRVSESIPATGEHRWGEWTVTAEADCTNTGLKEKVCEDCGEVETKTIPIAHDYATWEEVQTMNCDVENKVNGVKKAYCNKCNDVSYFTVPATHSYSGWKIVQPADCRIGQIGIKEKTCTACGDKVTEQYAYEHDFCEWMPKQYPVCNTVDENGDVVYGQAGIYVRECSFCKVKEQKSIPATHEFVTWETVAYPSCDEETNTVIAGQQKSKCKFCDAVQYRDLDCEHIYGEWITTVEPACTPETYGLEERTCYACGHKQTQQIEPHNFGAWVSVNGSAVCGTGNKTLEKTCEDCGITRRSSYVSDEHPNLIVNVIAPTCAASGYTSIYCPDCDMSVTESPVAPLGHELDKDWTIRIEPTCNMSGSKYKRCANCSYLEFVYIERTEHILNVLEPGVDPTCTESGLTPKTYCLLCREIFDAEVIEPTGHVATPGSDICAVCKAYFYVDGDGNVDVNNSYNCKCSCHSTNGLTALIFSIINKLYQAFGINQYCACHTEENPCLHYEEPGFLAQLFGKGNDTE